MKIKILGIIVFFFTILLQSQNDASIKQNESIFWYTDYKQAVEKSIEVKKPLLLNFSGSDWCGWCIKLDKEILNSKEFARLVRNKFVFVLVEFPRYKKLSNKFIKQNENLKNRFHIKGFPTILILDTDQNIIATTGYKHMTSEEYAEHLLLLLDKSF